MAAEPVPAAGKREGGALVALFRKVERIGNLLPDPLTLFAIMAAVVVVVSALLAGAHAEVIQRTGEVELKTVRSLLSAAGLRFILTRAVDNFIGFAPLGPVLTVMIGIGVAERTGFLALALRWLVAAVPRGMVTAALVFGGVMSSMAADAGYVVLTPLGAMIFAGMGRHPIAGLAATYAGVSGGFSANLLITGLDPMLARLTQQAAQVVDSEILVFATSNYYFMVVSTVLVTVLGTIVTTRIVEPMLGPWDRSQAGLDLPEPEAPTAREKRAFLIAMAAAAVVAAGIALLALLPASPLRDEVQEGAPAINALAPFFGSIELLVAILFILPGIVYGVVTASVRNDRDVARLAADSMAMMGPYIVLAFVAGQFVAYFNWTDLGAVTAVHGAGLLQRIGLTGIPLLLAFLVVSATMNIFVGSASAKWAFMAPIFVPMLMLMGFSPEAVQATYRVGDSVTNIITPLMPYLPIIIVFARRYQKDAGIGTILSPMLPHAIAFFLGWTVLLVGWLLLDLPLGPGASAHWAAPAAAGP